MKVLNPNYMTMNLPELVGLVVSGDRKARKALKYRARTEEAAKVELALLRRNGSADLAKARVNTVDLAFNPNQPRDSKGRWSRVAGAKALSRLRSLGLEVEVDAEARPGTGGVYLHKQDPNYGRILVGRLNWYKDSGQIGLVETREGFRRQGLATDMVDVARMVDPRVRHSTNLSGDGRKFAAATPQFDTEAPALDAAMKGYGKRGTGTGSGTAEDPINCRGNVVLAAKLLGEGKHVRLNHVDKIGTLLDRLDYLTQEAIKKGDKAPNYNLCQVSVPRTNLFCAKTKGIERVKMPQLGGVPAPGSKGDALPKVRGGEVDILPQFRAALEARGVKVHDLHVKANSLKATQNELIGAKVAGIYEAMRQAPLDSGLFAPIFVTRDHYVIDGHHRWAADVALQATKGTPHEEMTMRVEMIDMEIGEALAYANAFALDWGVGGKGFEAGPGYTGQASLSTTISRVRGRTVDLAVLSSAARDALPSSAFVFPKERRYPIHDLAHARNALARSSGKSEAAVVRAAVYRRYPQLRSN